MNLHNSIETIDSENWNKKGENVFLSHQFFRLLEQSNCLGEQRGWSPIYMEQDDNFTYSFKKTHSYGEYIFDWNWANAYHQNGYEYYPKLTSMIPFTPATTGHFIGEKPEKIFESYQNYYEQAEYASSHFLFITATEVDFFKARNYLLRDSIQYHFINRNYENFDHFLASLKSRKAKSIRKEREKVQKIEIQKYTGSQLKPEHAKQMYQFYKNTIGNKNAIAYLTESFFIDAFRQMNENILFVVALDNNIPIAGSVYFYDKKRLYGRYWGCLRPVESLHFELCYYQGIEFCIEKKLEVFEAGAQGEHKIARGFEVIKTKSAHQMKNKMFHQAIDSFIREETHHLDLLIPDLNRLLPYRNADT